MLPAVHVGLAATSLVQALALAGWTDAIARRRCHEGAVAVDGQIEINPASEVSPPCLIRVGHEYVEVVQ